MKKNILIILCVICYNILNAQRVSEYSKPDFEKNNFSYQKADWSVNSLLDNYDVKFYRIEVEVTNTSKNISNGLTTMNAQVVTNPLTTFVVELINSLVVDSVIINGTNYIFTHTNDEITVNLSSQIDVGNYFTSKIYYHGTSTGSGISNGTSPSWGKQIAWSLSESYHAKDWFPCKQVLSDKADSLEVFITCPNTLKAGSNGLLKNIVTVSGNKLRYEWKTNHPINYYLPSFAVSDYQEYNIYAHPAGISDSVLIQNYLYSNATYLPYFKAEIDNTPAFIELLSDKYGLYPFSNEKYGHCVAPIGGGMEHQTMTTLSSFNFELIIHELGHQWFGDYVTCANWQDIWVNEGFAEYTYYIGSQNLISQTDADQWMQNLHADIMSSNGGSVYVPISQVFDENRIFDYRLTYEKGAAIIHTIRYIINNDSIFFNFLKTYLQNYGDSVAVGTDFRNLLNSYTGIDFTDYFDQWYFGEGFPTYTISWQQVANNVSLNIGQQTSMPTVTPFFKLPLEIKFLWNGGDTTIRFNNTVNNENFSFVTNYTITSLQVDPDNWIVDGAANIINGIDNLNSFTMNVFPNPANDKISINVNDNLKNKSVTIYDLTGKSLKNITLNNNQNLINVSDLENGLYFIGTNNKINSKFVINR